MTPVPALPGHPGRRLIRCSRRTSSCRCWRCSTSPPRSAAALPARTWDNWEYVFTDDDFRSSIIYSLLLALFTVVLMVALLVPTMVWVRLRVPRARRADRVPLPAAADHPCAGGRGRHQQRLLVGDLPAGRLRAGAHLRLRRPRAALRLPRDRRPLVLDRRSRRSSRPPARWAPGWFTVIVRIIMPNITGGILGAAFIAVALVLGEYVARLAAALRHPAGGDGGHSTRATVPPPWPPRSPR